jgi:hypothetical protein
MALIVEDGTAKTTSESYISVADADTYHVAYTGSSSWTASTPTDAIKERVLRRATLVIDARYVLRWKGERFTENQALDWPRQDVEDASGYFILTTVIPVDLQRATAELALRELTETDGIIPDITDNGAIKREMIKVGPIENEIEFLGGGSPETKFTVVDKLLTDLLENTQIIRRG